MEKRGPHLCRHFGPLMGYCDHQIHTLMDRRLRSLDISPMQCRALAFLCQAKEPANQRSLEHHLMVKPSTVNGIVNRLEEKGLLIRSTSDRDARCRELHPTAAGLALHEQFRGIAEQVNAQMERGFTPQELDTLRTLLLRVADNLSDYSQEANT